MKNQYAYIALIRHGDYHQRAQMPSASQPFPLTPKGEQQAVACAHWLQSFCSQYPIQPALNIFSSTLLRAWQTADIIRRHWPMAPTTIVQSAALNERSVGSLANLTLDDIEQIMEQDPRHTAPPINWKSNSDYCLPFPGAESLLDAGARVAQLINQQSLQANKLHIFVGHGAAFRHAAYYLNILPFNDIKKLSMHHAQPVIYRRHLLHPIPAMDADLAHKHNTVDHLNAEHLRPEHLSVKHSNYEHLIGDWKIRNNHTLDMD